MKDHSNLTHAIDAKNPGIRESTLSRWIAESRASLSETIEMRGTGNYTSEERKEIVPLKCELYDTQLL